MYVRTTTSLTSNITAALVVLIVLQRMPHVSRIIAHTHIYVMARPWKAGNYLNNRSLVRFHIVWVAFCIRDSHEMGRARALLLSREGFDGGLPYHSAFLRPAHPSSRSKHKK